ncbi:MAG: hypothetical protein H6819_00865 [Phycisphaerales bacterium]|nr:hypothetical protein [Phycisphaerales bacterium]MCB9857241.1 hypothetical protein [Phycisphaerales bacterium]MCB9863045.1 hypothetical protein [Phycisphaerales bacterium]
MDTPKPTPKPVSGMSLHPPRPAGAPNPLRPTAPGQPAPRPASVRPPAPNTVRVAPKENAKPAPRDVPRPGGFRLLVGFVLALLGGLAIAYYPEPFVSNLEAVMTRFYEVKAGGLQVLSDSTSESPYLAKAIVRANEFRNQYGAFVRWTPQVVGIVCILLAGWCLKKRIGFFVAASLAFGITIGALAAAYDWFIPPHCITMPAFALGYLVESGLRPASVTIRGIVGFGFVLISIVGLTLGIFYLPRWGGEAGAIAESITQHGPAYLWSPPKAATAVYFLSATFVDQWTDVVLWGAVLLTSSIGAVVCKDKVLRFLSACLISTLAILLFKSAHVHWVHFPTLGVDIPPQPDWNYGNIEIWQWLALVELVIVAAVLLYKSVGAGGLTVGVALIWLCCSLHVDTYAGRLNTARLLSPAAAQHISSTPILPTDPMPTSTTRTGRGPMNQLGGVGAGLHMTEAEMAAAVAGAAAPVGWFYVTSFLIGIIAVGGLRMMIKCPEVRTWVMCLLWLGFAILAANVYWRWPDSQRFDIQSVAMTLSSHPVHRTIALCLAVGGAALFGTWALRWNSRYHTWLYAAATAIFAGTLLSFTALAVMIRWGGFDALPVQSYIVLAVGQSALMWVLLLHANFVHPEPAGVSAAAPQRRVA